jgi:hypothetical protein
MFLSHNTAVTIDAKLLSMIIISEAFLAISVPAFIAKPTDDLLEQEHH